MQKMLSSQLRSDAILKYFNDGFSYLEMVELLKHVQDFQISLSNLKI